MSSAPLTPLSADAQCPRRGVLCGVDHGRKRIGLAVTDSNQTLAMPLTTLLSKSQSHDAAGLLRIRDDYGVVAWIVGLPLHLSGEESPQSQLVRKFAGWLTQVSERPVFFWDERLSSSAAEAVLWSLGESPGRDKSRIDGLAAQHILQTFLRDRPGEVTPPEPQAG